MQQIKRFLDIVFSLTAITALSPLLLFIACRTMLGSKGGIIYTQQRIGRNGVPFTIYKFRSMYPNAEQNGPALSGPDDERITPWGGTMRKWKLDELPQLWNIIIGDMSMVGPRPERKYYIDQLVQLAPRYPELLRVKPGLTSWGMIRFGYASSVPEMAERMQYDLEYMDQLSLGLDFRIMLQTLRIILSGKGK